MKKKLFFTAITLIVIAAIVVFGIHNNSDTLKVPNLSLHVIDGNKLELNTLKGKPVFVTFWATTCTTCVKEIPHLTNLYQELGNEVFEIIAIAMPYDPPNLVVSMSKKKNISYPVVLDIEGVAAKAFGDVQVTPSSFLIDSQGNIVEHYKGKIDIEELRKKVKKLQKTTVSVT